jgi:hypothetical protein
MTYSTIPVNNEWGGISEDLVVAYCHIIWQSPRNPGSWSPCGLPSAGRSCTNVTLGILKLTVAAEPEGATPLIAMRAIQYDSEPVSSTSHLHSLFPWNLSTIILSVSHAAAFEEVSPPKFCRPKYWLCLPHPSYMPRQTHKFHDPDNSLSHRTEVMAT